MFGSGFPVMFSTPFKLQSKDGSFLSSPASTAAVFMHTGNKKCLEFLNFVLKKFGNHGINMTIRFRSSALFFSLFSLWKILKYKWKITNGEICYCSALSLSTWSIWTPVGRWYCWAARGWSPFQRGDQGDIGLCVQVSCLWCRSLLITSLILPEIYYLQNWCAATGTKEALDGQERIPSLILMIQSWAFESWDSMDTMFPQVRWWCQCIELYLAAKSLILSGYWLLQSTFLADVLKTFRDENGEFFCFLGQTQRGVTDMLNVNRGSHVAFPGETIMKEAKLCTERYLTNALENVGAFDKWALKKNIRGEVSNTDSYEFLYPNFISY